MLKYPLAYTTALTHHPETSSQDVQGIHACVYWLPDMQDNALAFTYTLTGNRSKLRIPPSRSPARADDLWRHTCCEAFIAVKGDSAYREFNFSPSGEWAMYQFHSYRQRAPLVEEERAPQIITHSTEESLTLEVCIFLPHLFIIQPLRLALSAVIEDNLGRLSYWALHHPPGKPDFHHPDAFVLEIEPPDREPTRRNTQ
jgi:hypothetical protein